MPPLIFVYIYQIYACNLVYYSCLYKSETVCHDYIINILRCM